MRIERLNELIDQFNLGAYRKDVIGLANYCVRFSCQPWNDEKLKTGATKKGGRPDVPKDFEWPHYEKGPLDFIGQINLGEFWYKDLKKNFPEKGLLSFFYDMHNYPWGNKQEHINACKVYYFENYSCGFEKKKHPEEPPFSGP